MTNENSSGEHFVRLVRVYSWITAVAVLYGILAAHVPFVIGMPWSSCTVCGSALGCVLSFHLLEVPLVSYQAFLAWYGLRRFTIDRSAQYESLISTAIAANLVFVVFETGLMLDGLRRDQPTWETVGLASIALMLMGGSFFGVYVKYRLAAFLR